MVRRGRGSSPHTTCYLFGLNALRTRAFFAPAQLRTRTDKSTKSRAKAPSGFEANQAEYDAAMEGNHPEYFRMMKEYGYEEVLSFVQQTNKSWLAGDLGRFILVRPPTAGHTRRIPCLAEPVTCDVAAPDAALPQDAGARHVQRRRRVP